MMALNPKLPLRVAAGLLRCPTDPTKLLMSLRNANALRPNMWEYPGGKLEPGERSVDAVLREWEEEIGIDVDVGEHLTTVHVPFEMGEVQIALFVLSIDERGNKLQVPRALASQQICWVHPTDAIKHLPCIPSTYLFYPAVLDFVTNV
jgi:8-oxo-dGTP diphosphatase